MFKVKRQPTVISVGALVKAILTGDYRWKYPETPGLVKILLANKFVLESVKQGLELDWGFVRENINNLNSACKDSDIAKFVAQVIDAKSFDFDNFSFLFEKASQSESEDFVVELLRWNNDINLDVRDSYDNTLLHAATKKGLANVCQVLLEKGLDVNSKNKYGSTPLHLAVREGHLEVTKILISAEANVNAKNEYGWTPLHFAAYIGSYQNSDFGWG
jgi:hypothetical protein